MNQRRFLAIALALIGSTIAAVPLATAQNKQVDTYKIARLEAGYSAQLAISTLMIKPDTLVWDGVERTGILKAMSENEGHKGELRLAIEKNELRQITFLITSADATKSAQLFDKVQADFEKRFGVPNGVYSNVQYLRKWTGNRQELMLKTADSSNFFSIVLRALDKPHVPDPANTPQDLKPTRQRDKRAPAGTK